MPKLSLASVLARSFVAGRPEVERLVANGTEILGRPWPWLPALAEQYVEYFDGTICPRHRDVVRFIVQTPDFQKAFEIDPDEPSDELNASFSSVDQRRRVLFFGAASFTGSSIPTPPRIDSPFTVPRK